MSDTKISALPAASAYLAADEFPINQGGTTKKITWSLLTAPLRPKFAVRAEASNWTLNSATYIAVTNLADLTLPAVAGDLLMVGIHSQWSFEAQHGYLDVATIVSASPVNSIALGAAWDASGTGGRAWYGSNNPARSQPVAGLIPYTVVAGDLDSGNVVLRAYGRSSGSKTLHGQTVNRLFFFAWNAGQ